ncbi:MAG: hypothetical protein MI923_04615 [Phycisphaerales bacterium]|nr:hypothetical protein [Phycisphaerales bacterium]
MVSVVDGKWRLGGVFQVARFHTCRGAFSLRLRMQCGVGCASHIFPSSTWSDRKIHRESVSFLSLRVVCVIVLKRKTPFDSAGVVVRDDIDRQRSMEHARQFQ